LHCPPTLRATLFPYTTLFRSGGLEIGDQTPARDDAHPEPDREHAVDARGHGGADLGVPVAHGAERPAMEDARVQERGHEQDELRSEEHTSELQSRSDLVCRLL